MCRIAPNQCRLESITGDLSRVRKRQERDFIFEQASGVKRPKSAGNPHNSAELAAG
jgi:hypothetical protein